MLRLTVSCERRATVLVLCLFKAVQWLEESSQRESHCVLLGLVDVDDLGDSLCCNHDGVDNIPLEFERAYSREFRTEIQPP